MLRFMLLTAASVGLWCAASDTPAIELAGRQPAFASHEDRGDHPRLGVQPNVALRSSRRELRIYDRLPFSAPRLTGEPLLTVNSPTAWFYHGRIRSLTIDSLLGLLHGPDITSARSRAPPIS